MIELTSREREVLRSVIHSYILNANPVGSRTLSKHYNLGLSPATIRNTMADLEESGLLEQPHTSAGRQPTDLGYRVYVDDLMEEKRLTPSEKRMIDGSVIASQADIKTILERTSALLGRMTNLLGIVSSPEIETGILHKINITRLSQKRLLVILTIKSGSVRTITLEINFKIENSDLEKTTIILNQRLSGLTMREIRESISERVQELPGSSKRDLITLFVENSNKLFKLDEHRQFYFAGLKTLINQPEFTQSDNLRTIIELMEDKRILVHLIGSGTPEDGVRVMIGNENQIAQPVDLSIVTSAYYMGENIGKVGIIGPKRMDYSKLHSIVDYTAKAIGKYFQQK